ncbi:protein root primordium defective 1 [Tanacetum coccineum]
MGLPDDFRETILGKCGEFQMDDGLETVSLVDKDGFHQGFKVAQVEIWRDKEYKDKWLSEFETKYAFPINFPIGFGIQPGFKDKLKEWQRLPYVKPYEKKEGFGSLTYQRFEKRAWVYLFINIGYNTASKDSM